MIKNLKSLFIEFQDRLGAKAVWMIVAIVAIGIIVLPMIEFDQRAYWVRVVGFTGLFIILGLGLNVVVGFAGLLDLGYVAFYAIGAYTYGLLASGQFGIHISFWIVLPLAAILAALSGVLLGIPVLRMRGDYLAIVTSGFWRNYSDFAK